MNRLIGFAAILLPLFGCDPQRVHAVDRWAEAMHEMLQAELVLDAGVARVECRIDGSGPRCALAPARIRPTAPRPQ